MSSSTRRATGFTLVELLVVVAIIGILSALVIPNARKAVDQARLTGLAADGRTLMTALRAYAADHAEYPPCCSPADEALDRSTLFPLTRDGYLTNGQGITGKLAGSQLTSYDSPDTPTLNGEFYAVLTHAKDPSLVLVVGETDDFPGHSGESLSGVYVLRDGALIPADEA